MLLLNKLETDGSLRLIGATLNRRFTQLVATLNRRFTQLVATLNRRFTQLTAGHDKTKKFRS
jgi:hypothetical protein